MSDAGFTMISNRVLRDGSLSLAARGLHAVLRDLAWQETGEVIDVYEDIELGLTEWGIADEAGCSRYELRGCLEELAAYGLVSRERPSRRARMVWTIRRLPEVAEDDDVVEDDSISADEPNASDGHDGSVPGELVEAAPLAEPGDLGYLFGGLFGDASGSNFEPLSGSDSGPPRARSLPFSKNLDQKTKNTHIAAANRRDSGGRPGGLSQVPLGRDLLDDLRTTILPLLADADDKTVTTWARTLLRAPRRVDPGIVDYLHDKLTGQPGLTPIPASALYITRTLEMHGSVYGCLPDSYSYRSVS